MAITMLAPNATPNFTVQARSGASYTADAGGLIYNVANNDVGDILNAGGNPANAQFGVRAGSASGVGALISESGNIARYISGTGQGNGADTTDDVLAVLALPANIFDVSGRILQISAAGKFGATANNKQVKCWVGPTAQTAGAALVATGMTSILASGVLTSNNLGWTLNAQIEKYGAAGSNTQLAMFQETVAGTTHLGTLLPVALTLAENAINYVVITGASGTTGAANDLVAMAAYLSFFN